MMSSFAPPTELPTWTSTNPRPLVPLQTCPEPSVLPSLPSPPRQPIFSNLYTLSTHIIPAAYPRVSLDVPLPERVPDIGIDQEERKKIIAQKAVEFLNTRHNEYTSEPTAAAGSKKLLWNCVNRYAKKDLNGQRGLTLFLAHANGFPKEVCFWLVFKVVLLLWFELVFVYRSGNHLCNVCLRIPPALT